MVRINLLPERKQAKAMASAEPGQVWLLAVLGAVVLEIVCLIVIHNIKDNELRRVAGENAKIQGDIDAIKRETANHNDIKTQLKELRDREEAIQKLQSARTGPTSTLMELSRILTTGKGPTTDRDKLEQLRHDNPTAVPNANWDPRRLWLTQYAEIERTVRMGGLARDGEDVSEFQRRLLLSDFFYEVKLLPGAKVIDDRTKQEVVRFELSAKVRY